MSNPDTLTITTAYKTNANGAGRITAKGAGKQRTLAYDHAASAERNHGLAAGELALVLGVTPEAAAAAVHMGFNDGTHKFVMPR